MKTIGGISANPAISQAGLEGLNRSPEPEAVAKEVESVFLNEYLKIILEQTSFGKDKTFSTYMPFITMEVSKQMAERGMGIGDFFLKSMSNNTISEKVPGQNVPSAGEEQASPEAVTAPRRKIGLPVEGRITSKYGFRHDPFDGKVKKHNGVDIAVPEGTPVTPAAPGKVVFSGFSKGYGNCVIVDHENGLTSIYGHSSENLVKTGDRVDKNSIIALSGSSGRSTGPHLHFELRKDGSPVDPMGQFG